MAEVFTEALPIVYLIFTNVWSNDHVNTKNERTDNMFTRNAMKFGVVIVGCAALVLALGGCPGGSKGGKTENGKITHTIDKDLTKGFSLSEDQALTAQDRTVYEAERHNDVFPAHNKTNGTYVKTSADEGKIWHWGI